MGNVDSKDGGAKLPAPLPGLGGGQKAVIPPFMQQAEPPKPTGPSRDQLARDPFAAENLPPQRPSFIPADAGLIEDKGPAFSEKEAGRSRKPIILGALALVFVCFLLGFLGGKAMGGRIALNIAIRDALIVQYELQKSAKVFDEVEGMINSALMDAQKRVYHPNHIEFLSQNVHGNPVNARIFTDRNYKNFDMAAVQWLNNHFTKWGELYNLIETHRRKTKNDESALTAAGEEFKKLLTTQYGAVFTRAEKAGGQLQADIVVLAGCAESKGAMKCKVQVDTGTYGDERDLYNPEGPDQELTKEPDKYVVAIGENSKMGLLKNATQSHFEEYLARLAEMSELMRAMRENQQNLLNKISEICSQEPVSFGGIDVEAEVAEYIEKDKSGQNAPAEAAAE